MSDTINAILNSKKIKYSVLKELINDLPEDTEELNLFISVESIMKHFYNKKVNEIFNSLTNDDKYILSSELINIAAHYRHFFWSRYNITTNFYFYYSSEKAEHNREIFNDYRLSYYNKTIDDKVEFKALNKLINTNLKLANIISEYLPNIYFIDTKTLEPSVLVQYIVGKIKNIPEITNLVLTNNTLDYQLVNLPRTFILEMKMDDSYIISKNNIYKTLLKKSKTRDNSILDSSFYTSVLAISGFKKYDIEGLKGSGLIKTIAKLERDITNNKITNDEISSNLLLTADKIYEDNTDIIKRNYKLLSYEYQRKQITPKEIHNIDLQLNNKSDNVSLMEINRMYYEQYPLMLIELMEGEY